jgi:hypothetical protein
VATAITADSTNVGEWVPITLGSIAGILTLGLLGDVLRRR